jgi:hypothetical protein
MHIVLHGPRLAPRFLRGCVPKELCRDPKAQRWLSENWVDGFDNGENELDWIL